MNLIQALVTSLISSLRDVIPICIVIIFFQLFVLRRRVANLRRVLAGLACVVAGLAIFLVGLETALFPLGETMARQLSSPEFVQRSTQSDPAAVSPWYDYYWTYAFAFLIGFSATLAEPALLAVAIKANEASGGTIKVWGLRGAVAIGSGIGVALGTFRIVTGLSLPGFILVGYVLVIVQTWFAPKQIVPLAYDSGGVTTSTVTVPLVTALGLGTRRTDSRPQFAVRRLWHDRSDCLVSNDYCDGICTTGTMVEFTIRDCPVTDCSTASGDQCKAIVRVEDRTLSGDSECISN